jgi:putative SOS response-associated peptidase YedK
MLAAQLFPGLEAQPLRYNIAPTQRVPVVTVDESGRRVLRLMRWGLVPHWAKDLSIGTKLINARAETLAEKPAFRDAVRHRRCLIPADGFYEWKGAPGAKRPHLVKPRAGGPMALAGIFENWLGADGSEIETVAILTVAANAAMSALHYRMPAIIAPEHFDAWLECRSGTAAEIAELLVPAPEGYLDIIEVSRALNNPRNEGPEVQEPAGTLTLL